jgi:hypothetical protein
MKNFKILLLPAIAGIFLLLSSCNQNQSGHMMNGNSWGWGMGGGIWFSTFAIILVLAVVIAIIYFSKSKRQK